MRNCNPFTSPADLADQDHLLVRRHVLPALVIVGHVWLHTLHKIPNPVAEPETHGYLSNLYVKPSERGGTGTQLLDTAIKWARSNRIDRLVLWPSPRSVTLYLRHGFSHGGEVMELNVANPR